MSIHKETPRGYHELDDIEKLLYFRQYEKFDKKTEELMEATVNRVPEAEWTRIQNERIRLWQTIPGTIMGNMYWGKYEDVVRN